MDPTVPGDAEVFGIIPPTARDEDEAAAATGTTADAPSSLPAERKSSADHSSSLTAKFGKIVSKIAPGAAGQRDDKTTASQQQQEQQQQKPFNPPLSTHASPPAFGEAGLMRMRSSDPEALGPNQGESVTAATTTTEKRPVGVLERSISSIPQNDDAETPVAAGADGDGGAAGRKRLERTISSIPADDYESGRER